MSFLSHSIGLDIICLIVDLQIYIIHSIYMTQCFFLLLLLSFKRVYIDFRAISPRIHPESIIISWDPLEIQKKKKQNNNSLSLCRVHVRVEKNYFVFSSVLSGKPIEVTKKEISNNEKKRLSNSNGFPWFSQNGVFVQKWSFCAKIGFLQKRKIIKKIKNVAIDAKRSDRCPSFNRIEINSMINT